MVLATASKPELTAAVSGTFSGPANTGSQLNWSIHLHEQTEAEPMTGSAAMVQAASSAVA